MATFQPIRRTGQEVQGPDRQYPGLLVVEVAVSPDPPREWVSLWNPYPPNATYSISYGPPQVHGSVITLRVPDEQIKSAVESLDKQIAAANAYFEAEVLPRIQTAEDRARKEAEDEAARLDEARRKLDEIDDPDLED